MFTDRIQGIISSGYGADHSSGAAFFVTEDRGRSGAVSLVVNIGQTVPADGAEGREIRVSMEKDGEIRVTVDGRTVSRH